jgi:hypothetical protein
MLYREIIAVCSEIHTKHINTVCGQNVGFFDVITSLVSMEHGVYGCEKLTSLGEVTSNGLA